MLIFLWLSIIVANFFPAGDRLVADYAHSMEAHLRATLEATEARPGLAIGAAASFVR